MADLDKLRAAAGDYTVAKLKAYQAAHHLPTTGIADPATLVQAGVYPAPTGQAGSSFVRAFIASESQIPQWAWLGGAAVSGVIAYLAYRSRNPSSTRGRR